MDARAVARRLTRHCVHFTREYAFAVNLVLLLQLYIVSVQSGYRPGSFPPTRDNCVRDDMPWTAGLHAVLPRLLRVAATTVRATPQQPRSTMVESLDSWET